jgi:hypothetical protein
MNRETKTPIVVHALISRPGWIEEVEAGMKTGQEVILLAQALTPARIKDLTGLAEKYEYHPPAPLPEEQWRSYQYKMKLTDLAAKEQGISPNLVYLLRPCAQPFPESPGPDAPGQG